MKCKNESRDFKMFKKHESLLKPVPSTGKISILSVLHEQKKIIAYASPKVLNEVKNFHMQQKHNTFTDLITIL